MTDIIHLNAWPFCSYAPWCGHCKKLAPIYEHLARTLKESNPEVMVASVDSTIETGLKRQFKVKGFPSIVLYVAHGQQQQQHPAPS
jgi:thioredoxin-like negative regulator of GroEL